MNIDTDFIKWMVGYAEKFEICNGWIRTPDEDCRFELVNKADFIDEEWVAMVYPLLLTKAIDGINMTNKTYTIEVGEQVCVYEYMPEDDGIYFSTAKTVDKERERALHYLYEMEK